MSVVPRSTLGVLVVALLAMGGATQTSGAADPKRGLCAGKLCLFAGTLGTEERVNFTALGISNRLAKKMDNEASSVYNDRDGVAIIYAGRNGNGAKLCLESGDAFSDMSEINFDNKASSTRLTDRKNCPV